MLVDYVARAPILFVNVALGGVTDDETRSPDVPAAVCRSSATSTMAFIAECCLHGHSIYPPETPFVSRFVALQSALLSYNSVVPPGLKSGGCNEVFCTSLH